MHDDLLEVEGVSFAYLGRFTALDPRTQQWLMELIVELGRAGKTIVLATHDLASLDTLAERCLVLGEDHRIVADGSPHDILSDRDLLLAVNLVHEHTHAHRGLAHTHEHDGIHHNSAQHEPRRRLMDR